MYGYSWMPDNWCENGDGTISYRLRPRYFNTYNLTNTGDPSNVSMRIAMSENGTGVISDAPGPPQLSLYKVPTQSNALDIGAQYKDVTASNPPIFINSANAIPVADGVGNLGFWVSAHDGTNPWFAMQGSSETLGWFSSEQFDAIFIYGQAFGSTFWQDLKNRRTIGLYLPTAGQILTQFVSFETGFPIVTFTGGVNPDNSWNGTTTGYDWIDQPQFAQPYYNGNEFIGWLLLADNLNPDATPLVPNGSPLFLLLPDLSGFYEIVFTNGDGLVDPNDQGGFGVPFDFANIFQVQVQQSPNGDLYYLQLNGAATEYNVYATVNPASKTKKYDGGLPTQPLPFCMRKETIFS